MGVNWIRGLLLGLGLVLTSAAWAQSACERYELLTPKRGDQIADRQPELQWGGDANAGYRLQVAVILPEGRILESIDTVVTGTRWRLGAPVNVLTAAVKVIVSRNCPMLTVQDLHAQGPYFIIQAADQCALMPQSLRRQGDTLHWNAGPQADKFVVQVFLLTQSTDGEMKTRRIGEYEAAGPSWTLPTSLKSQFDLGSASRSWVATVQARCGTLLSLPQAVPLNVVP